MANITTIFKYVTRPRPNLESVVLKKLTSKYLIFISAHADFSQGLCLVLVYVLKVLN